MQMRALQNLLNISWKLIGENHCLLRMVPIHIVPMREHDLAHISDLHYVKRMHIRGSHEYPRKPEYSIRMMTMPH